VEVSLTQFSNTGLRTIGAKPNNKVRGVFSSHAEYCNEFSTSLVQHPFFLYKRDPETNPSTSLRTGFGMTAKIHVFLTQDRRNPSLHCTTE
jgi:hypothetical protein